ncbi:MAG: CDP-glucose 4,6-dehydratase [Gammaproteobacteria bacterium]|nr:CDP-glucose 4,6-dehydratase [Gammaproteobacteria bacterium]
MGINQVFWKGKKVLITGHTGFKGAWLSLWLQDLGAKVIGISLDSPTTPSLYEQANVAKGMISLRQDIRNGEAIKQLFQQHKPEIVFHLAAQPLVRYSYQNPVETYETNVMGTLHVLEGIRSVDSVRSAVMITTDKCYQNKEWVWGYRETDTLGGHDPYSSSKGAAELLISSYRNSYFPQDKYSEHKTAIASARAGNVIGGGDWAEDRLIPDIIKAFKNNETVIIRNPKSTRPWQHVLEPLSGYLKLAEQLEKNGDQYAEAWNFGPAEIDARPVQWIVEKMAKLWGENANWINDKSEHLHEANYLKLDCSKAHMKLNWYPRWDLSETLLRIVEWHKLKDAHNNYRKLCLTQINDYMKDMNNENC